MRIKESSEKMDRIKVVFMGTPDFAVPVLEELIKVTDVCLVVTQPDKEVGRHHEISFSPIKKVALNHDIKVFQPSKIRIDNEVIMNEKPDLIVTCAYGQIIPEKILNLPRLGCVNVHASLLPKLRGGAPIHRSIINGDDKTGITIMYMDKSMDTGDIISQRECPILDTDNVGILHDKLSKIGAELLMDTLPSIVNGTNDRIKQNNDEATYAYNISREDEHIDFNDLAINVYNKVRGLNPWPVAYTIINGEEVKVLDCYISEEDSVFSSGTICCIDKGKFGICAKDKVVYIKTVKPSGKRQMDINDYINGIRREDVLNTICE